MELANVNATPGRGTILIVEDDHDIRVSIRGLLEHEGYRVLSVANGSAALDLLQDTTPRPALIVLDLMLPVMDGWQFVAHVDRRPSLAGIPIVVMTAYDTTKAPDGVVAVIKKPVNMGALLQLVAHACEPDATFKD
jgi:two-component system, chemotaxis family, chemotaxis protein CheY